MVTSFIETPRFPDDISYGSSGGPGFKTVVYEGHSGVEQRSIEWSIARAKYSISHVTKDKDLMDELRKWFRVLRGRACGFRFKDWGDYDLDDETIGTGDGDNDTFYVTKTYTVGGGGTDYVRRIFKPVSTDFVVTVDDVVIPHGTGSTQVDIDFTTGILVFGADVIPADTKVVKVTGEFDVPCRLDTDVMDANHDGFLTESWSSMGVQELLLDEDEIDS